MEILGVKRVKFALRCQNDLKNISHEKQHLFLSHFRMNSLSTHVENVSPRKLSLHTVSVGYQG